MTDFQDTCLAGEPGHLVPDTLKGTAGLDYSLQEEGPGQLFTATQTSTAGPKISSREDECDQSTYDPRTGHVALDNSASAEPGQTSRDPHITSAGLSHSGQLDGIDHVPLGPHQNNVDADNTPVLVQPSQVAHTAYGEDRRFTDPLVMEIMMLHRMRRRWMKARNSLVLQEKAICRSFSNGDKDAGAKAFDRILAGKPKDGDEMMEMALMPFIPAVTKFDADMAPIEKQMVRLAKKLPIAKWADGVRGLGAASVAAIVGEAGDLSVYPTVSGVWKRLGLAVIEGGRQRRVANAEAALEHGYSPERRSVVWVMADAMAKHQRTWIDKKTGEVTKPAGPYGEILEAEKAKALAKGWTPLHAENHAKRVMSKAVLRDMTLEWRKAVIA